MLTTTVLMLCRYLKYLRCTTHFSLQHHLTAVEFGPLGGRDDGEQNGIGFIEICEVFAILHESFFRTEPFDSLYQRGIQLR